MVRSKLRNEDDLWMEHLLNEVEVRLKGDEIETGKYEVENNALHLEEIEKDELENEDEINQQSTRFTEVIFTCFVLIMFFFTCVILYIQLLSL